jgi:hypothetical protein
MVVCGIDRSLWLWRDAGTWLETTCHTGSGAKQRDETQKYYNTRNQPVYVVSSNTFKLQLVLTNAMLTASSLKFGLQLSPGLNGHVPVSSNLLNWTTLTNFVGTNTSLTVHEPSATKASVRFHRTESPGSFRPALLAGPTPAGALSELTLRVFPVRHLAPWR